MTLYSKNGATPRPLPYSIRLSDGRLRTDPTTFTDAEIADAGYVEAPARPATEWYEQAVWNGGTLTWLVQDRPLSDVIDARVREVEDTHNAILNGGFTYDFGSKVATLEDGTTETAGVRVLQTRPMDRERWATTNQVATQYIGAGVPTEPMRPFRTKDNARVPVTAQEANACLNAMQAYFGQALDATWDHKDAIRQMADVDSVVQYDISSLWP